MHHFNVIDYFRPLVNCYGVNHIRRKGNVVVDYLVNVSCGRLELFRVFFVINTSTSMRRLFPFLVAIQ